MDVATPQSDLYNKLLQIGWTLKKIDFKQGVYTAKAENQTTGQEIERAAKSPEMALAAVLRYAVAANEVRRFAATRFAAWDSDWSGNSSDIAQAYAQMPAFEQKAVPAWKALAAEANVQATAIKKQITVEVVDDPDPYMDVKQLIEDVHQNRHVSISRADSDHPVWTVEDVVNFRTVLDVIGHAQNGAGFSFSGEVKAAETWMPLLSPLAREALFTEVIGRGAYDKSFRGNAPHKIGLLSQFLHPTQEKQGEHVWIPHGGLPELAPQEEQPMTPFGPAVPEGYASPAFERDPAVMEGYKPQKITRSEALAALEWGDTEQPEQPQWVTHIPCPQNIPIKPEREVEYPDWIPEEDDPLTVPEEWPEEAPTEAPEREPEKEPAVSKVRVSNEDLPLIYSQEPGYGWKILITDEQGTLISPSQGTLWPVGQPLVAEDFDLDEFKRNSGGIHLVPEGDWGELDAYKTAVNAVLVKCKLFGRTLEGTTAHGRGMLASKAMPVLAVSPHQELLLKIANKYGIDTELVGDHPEPQQPNTEGYGLTLFQQGGWRLIDPEGEPEEKAVFPENASYKNFSFEPPKDRTRRFRREMRTFDVVDPTGNPAGTISMELDEDYSGNIDYCEVENEPQVETDAIPFVKAFFESLPVRAEYPKSEAWENSEWEYDYWDDSARDKDNPQDADSLISLVTGGRGSQYGYTLDQFSYEGWEYEWDDSDVSYEMSESPDEYGIYHWDITIKEVPPPILDFEPQEWTAIFNEEIETLKSGWSEPTSGDLARALVEIPEFILTENAQDGTVARKAWETVGGLNFIKGEIDNLRWTMNSEGEQPTLELTDWLYQLESAMAGAGGRGGWSMNPGQPPLFTTDQGKSWKDMNLDAWKGKSFEIPGQEQIPGTLSKVGTREPDYLFVYYKSELRMKKWEHSLRQADMLEELLDEFDVDMGNSGLDIDPAEVAAGEIYAYPDGEYRVEHKQLSNPDVREYAEDLIQDWLWDWRSLDQARDPSSGQFV
jgi:hypothetical protein